MKVTLEFTDDERENAEMAMNGDLANCALREIDEYCRSIIKHHDISEKEQERLDSVRSLCQPHLIN